MQGLRPTLLIVGWPLIVSTESPGPCRPLPPAPGT